MYILFIKISISALDIIKPIICNNTRFRIFHQEGVCFVVIHFKSYKEYLYMKLLLIPTQIHKDELIEKCFGGSQFISKELGETLIRPNL